MASSFDMISAFSSLSVWQELLLLGLGLTSLVYVLYFRIWAMLAVGSDLLFAGALALAVTSVALPVAFEPAAATLIDRSPLPEALAAADEKVAEIEALPRVLIERALAQIGYESETPDHGAGIDASQLMEPESEPGPFASKIRPSVEALVVGVLRTSSFVTAAILLFLSLALRSSTSTARELRKLSVRLEKFEARQNDRSS